MVLQIRELRPDVIITNHDTTSGHGHHQATGRLILQAFDAAADPKQFPEQLTQVGTWQPQRLFVRGFGGNQPAAPTTIEPQQPMVVTIDPNERDPIRGTTYAQQALAALQRHATQGPWPKLFLRVGPASLIHTGALGQLSRVAAAEHDPARRSQITGINCSKIRTPAIDGKPLTEFIDNRGECWSP